LALQKETPPTGALRGRLRYGLLDLFVVAACSLTFVVVMGAKHVASKGPPIGLIAQELGTTPEQFQQAADRFLSARTADGGAEEAGCDDPGRLRRAVGCGHGKVSPGQAAAAMRRQPCTPS
jgi:hypothetical protein